jgi:hypothetical protein
MTFSELQTSVNRFLGRSTTHKGSWEDDEVKEAINEALVLTELTIDETFEYYFIAFAFIPEVSGQQTYNLPSDCKSVVSIERQNSSGGLLQPLFLKYIQHQTAEEEFYRFVSGTVSIFGYSVEAYQQEGSDKIRLMVPSATTAEGDLVLVYIRKLPELVSDDDIPGIPEEYHSVIKWMAINLLLPKEEEGGPKASLAMRLSGVWTEKLITHVKSKNIQSAKYVNFTDTGEI